MRIGINVLTSAGLLQSLPASSFRIEDNGTPVAWTLLQNTAPPPKVLFVVDDSDSVPEAFRATSLRALLRDVAQDVQTVAPEAEFRVHKISTSITLNDWTRIPTDLDAQVDNGFAFGSDIWGSLATSSRAQPNVCVVITDGAATDSRTEALEMGIRRMPPCVFLSVGADPAVSVLPELATLVSGDLFEVSDVVVAKQKILTHAQEKRFDVVGTYRAPSATLQEHTVRIRLGAAETTARYTPAAVRAESEIAGLELVVRQWPRGEVRRWLVGDGVTAVPVASLQRALVGRRLLSFEGEGASVHERLDEILTARLEHRPLFDAVRSGDPEAMRDRLVEGVRQVPAEVLTLMTRPPQLERAVLYQDGLRTVLLQDMPTAEDRAVGTVDLFAQTGYGLRSPAADRRAAFEQALQASLHLAVAEATLYPQSTLAALADQELTYLAPGAAIESVAPALDDASKAAWQRAMRDHTSMHRVVPASGSPVAFFSIEPTTGHTVAVLPDGSGGGVRAVALRAERDRVIAMLNWFGFGSGLAGASTGFGFWVALQKAVAKQILTATIAIVELESPEAGADLPGTAADVVCDGIKGGLLGSGGAAGAAIGNLDAFAEAATGESAIDCF